MNAIVTVARKELRSYFQSPVALIFLGVFLAFTLFTFFGTSRFFARNIADVRPLFQWLPVLLIFLVSAITMRQWAEEKKMGTLEVLLTLPLSTRDLVLGKFVAGVALVALALLLTTPLPMMVYALGPLDPGPVIGGYLGALLLGATYVAIGLCVSARTDNMVVSLMLTLVVGGAIYIVGTDQFTALFGNAGAEILRGVGTGSRFASIERGVIDLRDLAYYGGLTAFFLVLNWYFVEHDRLDAGSNSGRSRAAAQRTLVALAAANTVLLVVWLTPVTAARWDLTQNNDYSITSVTVGVLEDLAEPLVIHGYFSERTHPKLAPLIPTIRDLLYEYQVQGGGKVEVAFFDPNADEELEAEINEQYSIRPVPFQVADRHQQAVVNSYFHILIKYGDQNQTLSFQDLIEVHADDTGLEVRLKNLEYDVTRTIKKLSQEFQSNESIFAALPAPMEFTLYASDGIPDDWAEVPARVRTAAQAIVTDSDGKFVFTEVDPKSDPGVAEQIYQAYGIRPLAVDLFGRNTFFLDGIVKQGDRVERVVLRGDVTENDVGTAIDAAIRRVTPGQTKTVAILTEIPVPPPPNPQIPPQFQPPPPQPDYQSLRQLLSDDYNVEEANLDEGEVNAAVDVLIVGKPGALTDKQRFAIDQFLMRGGKVVAMAGSKAIGIGQQGLEVNDVGPSLNEMLAAWGVEVGAPMAMDPQNAPFPMPVQERRGPFTVQKIQMLDYPFFADIRSDGMAEHAMLTGINNVTTPWASPLTVKGGEGIESTTLLKTSPGTWLNTDGNINPDFGKWPDKGFGPSGSEDRRVVAAALSGAFPSFFADRPSPLFEGDASADGADATGRTIKQAMPDARLVVFGSSEVVSDLMLNIASQGGEMHKANLQLLRNAVDWSVEDTDLLQIRTSGAFARTLRPIDDDEASLWELMQYALAALLLFFVGVMPRQRRRSIKPLAMAGGQA